MRRVDRLTALALLSGLAVGATGSAHANECSVEDWRYNHVASLQNVRIEGSTTCEKGRIRIRAYDTSGDSPKFLGVATGVVQGYIFETYVEDIPENPESMEIKYSIEVR